MAFRKSLPFWFLCFGFMTQSTQVQAQTRINTSKLGEKLLAMAKEEQALADQLKRQAEQARLKANESEEAVARYNAELAAIEKSLAEIRGTKKKLLREVVDSLMNNPEIGHLLREKPERIRLIPAIDQLLKDVPWLNQTLDEILLEYSTGS